MICVKCKIEKLPEEFNTHQGTASGLQSLCKECIREIRPKKTKNQILYSCHRITESEYLSLYVEQQGGCAICKAPASVLSVDHCHSTGQIRGLLCDNCNHGIGCFKDNILVLQSAIAYLEKPRPFDLARIMLLLEKESKSPRKLRGSAR